MHIAHLRLLSYLIFQEFDKVELLECIKKLVEVDQEWVPYSTEASLYIRPTFIGIEVRVASKPVNS